MVFSRLPFTVSVAAMWDTSRCFASLTTAQRWNFAAAHVTLFSLFGRHTAATISINVSKAALERESLYQPGCSVGQCRMCVCVCFEENIWHLDTKIIYQTLKQICSFFVICHLAFNQPHNSSPILMSFNSCGVELITRVTIKKKSNGLLTF